MITKIIKSLIFTIIISSISSGLFNFVELNAQNRKNKQIELTDKPPLYRVGIYGGINFNFHSSDFTKLPGVPNCCTKFESAYDDGISIGGLFDYTLNENSGIDFRLGYASYNGIYDVRQNIGNTWVLDALTNDRVAITDAVVNHNLVARISSINFIPSYRYSFNKLNLLGGLRVGYVSSSSYEQQEKLLEPENVVFENGKLSRNIYVGNQIPDMSSLLFALNFGVSYDLNFNQKLVVAPELRYELNLNNVNSESWKISTLVFGAAIKYPVYEKKDPDPIPIKEETIYQRDTMIVYNPTIKTEVIKLLSSNEKLKVIETDEYTLNQKIIAEKYEKTLPKVINIDCDMEIMGVLADGTKQETPTLIIEETEVTESFPILPHVFFAENSSDLTKSGLNLLRTIEVEKFDEQKLDKSTLSLYSNMLNIIGNRLKFNPKAKIKIVGTNKNKGVELNNAELSNSRALAVKKYLVDIWNIDASRIEIQKRNLPQNPGNINVTEGELENQRAEIYSDDFNILRPINISNIEKKSNPPLMTIKPKFQFDEEVNNPKVLWNLELSQDNKLLRRTTSDLEFDGIYDWNVLDEPMPTLEKPIEVKLDAKNEFGSLCSKTKKIEIKQLTIKKKRYELKDDHKIEKYALIVFDFDQSKLTEQHKIILGEIKKKIQPNSKVKILGYTDVIGEMTYNENLARRRATEVQNFLNVKAENLDLQAIGSKELLYDNSTPQGRAFCRTVIIEIATPVKED